MYTKGLMKSHVFIGAAFLSFVLLLIGCGKLGGENIKNIDLNAKEKVDTFSPEVKGITVGISAMISPKETFNYYVDLVNYIGEKLGMPSKIAQRKTYKEMNDLIKEKGVDFAFVCSGPYVSGHKEFGMELLAAPQVSGEPIYHSLIIAHKDSDIKKLEDLEGKTFAFTDPESNTGKLVPTYMVEQIGKTPETFFKETIFTHSHDNSIHSVADKVVDAAAVDSLIFDYISATNPEMVSKIKIIVKSPAYGIPPVVVPFGVDPQLKEKVRDILLHMHEDAKGSKILKGIMIERFVVVEDSLYSSVREMQDWIEAKKSK